MTLVIAALFIAGAVFLAVSIGLIARGRRGASDYVHTTAVVESIMLGESMGTVRPLVEFQADGKTVRQRAHEIKSSRFTGKPGDTIKIVYRRSTVVGVDFWDITVDQGDVDTILKNQNRLVSAIGWLFSGLGAVIIIVAVALLRR